jgi:FtsP/CotA-like multicopper oxidase with cupredoxin domain
MRMPKLPIGSRWLPVLALAASLMAAMPSAATHMASAQTPSSGIVCTTSASPNATFTLTAKSDYIAMPDGNTILTWSYANGNGNFQFPGPVLCVNQGDTVTVVLNNTLPEPVSIIFPSIDNVLANGAPAQPQFSGTTLTSLVPSAAAGTGSMTYSFVASNPGTYLYESGTDPGKQVQMGLYGALVVRPTGNPACAYDCALTRFNPATEYVMLFSELDPSLHEAVERGQPYDVTTLHPRYWLINGRSFPDTIAPNNAAWLPEQPYSALVHMHPKDTSNPDPALVRYLNAGTRNHPFHPHGQNGRIIARDARPLATATNQDLSYETFAFTIGSGQTWDGTYEFVNQEGFDPVTNPIPVTIPQLQNLTFKDSATWYGGSPYLGYKGTLPQGVTSYNECGEYYIVFHSHALNEVANFDAGFGGMLTLQRVDPPLPNTCP